MRDLKTCIESVPAQGIGPDWGHDSSPDVMI